MVTQTAERQQQQDPAWILDHLPDEAHRTEFLREYRAAAAQAADPGRYGDLQSVVRRWWLLALTVSAPDYAARTAEVAEQIRTGTPGIPMEDLIRERQATRNAR